MSQLPANEAIDRFKANEARVDTFVNEEGFYTTTGGEQVETLPSFMARKDAAIDARYPGDNFRGDFVMGDDYATNDVVKSGGLAFIAINAVTNASVAPQDDGVNWRVWQGLTTSDVADFLMLDETNITINVPSEYATIQAALNSIATKVIPNNVTITIKVADGTHTPPAGTLLNHPFGDRIRLIGNETNPDLCVLMGPNPPTFNMLACTNGNKFGYINGFKIDLPAKASLANNYSGIIALNGATINCGPKIKVNNYFYGINASYGSVINADYAEVSNAGDVGIWAFCGSQINARNAKSDNCSDVANNWGFGFQAEYGSNVNCEGATASENYIAGFAALSNSQVRALNTAATSNGSGYKAQDNASIEAHNAVSNSNNLYGYFQQGSGRIFGANMTGSGNVTALFNPIAYFDNSGSIGARVASTSGGLRLDTNDKSSAYFHTQEGLQFEVSNTDAATSHFVVQGGGASTGNQPILRPSGAAADIPSRYDSKGNAPHYFNTGGGLQLEIANVNSAVNHIQVHGGAIGNSVKLIAAGSDSIVDLSLFPKGAGSYVQIGAGYNTTADVPIIGYIAIRDNIGTLRKLAIIA